MVEAVAGTCSYQRDRGAMASELSKDPLSRSVLLVDDHEFIRVGVRSAYASIDGVTVTWHEAGSLIEAMRLYGSHRFDAVLLDLNLADCKGLQGLRQFLRTYPEAHVAIFSATHDEFVVRQARALGAAAYISKTAGVTDLQNALRRLLMLKSDPAPQPGAHGAANPLFPHCNTSSVYDRVAELGPRHLEILELVLSGCTNQEISHATQLSLGTVKNYVSSLLLALDVKSRSHLISLFR